MKSFISSVSAVFVALTACTCCIGPLMSLAGMLGVTASQLIWLSSIKNYLIAFSLLSISYNLYRAYFPQKQNECCELDAYEEFSKLNKTERKTVSFFQSKAFLWSIAMLTILILIFPYVFN